MKVILLTDVKNQGKKGDVINVSDAYARNVLFAKKQAVEANGKTLNDLKLQNAHAEKVAEENYENAVKLSEDLKDQVVKVTIRAGKEGKTFGSISTKEISEACKKQLGIELDKKKMVIAEPIKALGTYEVSIKLHPKVTGTLRVNVTEE